MKLNYVFLAIVATFALAACKPTDTTAPATTEATEAAPAATTEAAPAAAADSTGVAECDDYFAKVTACFADKIPAEQRAMFEEGFEQTKAAMMQQTDKALLAQACTAALEQSKDAYTAFGCNL